MLEVYQTDGIIAEPAGALATAVLGHGVDLQPGSTVVCLLSGGNNDVSRYGEVIERSLVHEGLKHYFLLDFPQEPGALRRLLSEVLGPEDDITLFEYVKRNNRETGPALVGIEIGAKEDLEPLLDRMAHARSRSIGWIRTVRCFATYGDVVGGLWHGGGHGTRIAGIAHCHLSGGGP
jgi:threonine dehydratase